jgi:hypothetical protein
MKFNTRLEAERAPSELVEVRDGAFVASCTRCEFRDNGQQCYSPGTASGFGMSPGWYCSAHRRFLMGMSSPECMHKELGAQRIGFYLPVVAHAGEQHTARLEVNK